MMPEFQEEEGGDFKLFFLIPTNIYFLLFSFLLLRASKLPQETSVGLSGVYINIQGDILLPKCQLTFKIVKS